MKTKLSSRFWVALTLFSLVGQVAWVVENMYFNVFIYKMFRASAADISAMVGASSVAATVATDSLSEVQVTERSTTVQGRMLAVRVRELPFSTDAVSAEICMPVMVSVGAVQLSPEVLEGIIRADRLSHRSSYWVNSPVAGSIS